MPSLTPPTSFLALFLVLGFALLFYIFLVLHARRQPVEQADDQIGFKVVVAAFLMYGLALALMGLSSILHFVLSLFDNSMDIKEGLPQLVIGGAVAGGVYLFLVKLTNVENHPKISRMVLGSVGLVCGLTAIGGLTDFLTQLFMGASWSIITHGLSTAIAFGIGGAGALFLFIRTIKGGDLFSVSLAGPTVGARAPIVHRPSAPQSAPQAAPQEAMPNEHPEAYTVQTPAVQGGQPADYYGDSRPQARHGGYIGGRRDGEG